MTGMVKCDKWQCDLVGGLLVEAVAIFRSAVALSALRLVVFIAIMPSKLLASFYIACGEEGGVRKARILMISKHVLYADVRRAGVVEESANVTFMRGIDKGSGVLAHVRIGLGELFMVRWNNATMVFVEEEARVRVGRL